MNGTAEGGRPFADLVRAQLGLGSAPGKKAPKKPAEAGPVEDGGDKERDDVAGVVNLRKLATVCFKYDPKSLVHGVFLEKIAGRLRHPRALSSFIEASGVGRADSGGVKFDRALPKPRVAGVDAKGGYGNVPFHRTEFTAESIIAYFSLDLAQIRGYGLPGEASELLTIFSLWKVRRFLESNMRLRSACELEVDEKAGGIRAVRPEGFTLPPVSVLTARLAELIAACNPYFADPTTTVLTWNKPAGKE
jgi:CRISPR-associated protein Csb1